MENRRGSQASSKAWALARWIVESAALVAFAFLLAATFRATIAQAYEIPTPSMEPAIRVHDRVLAEKLTPRLGTPAVGDVVVISDPAGGAIPFIKRVIALPGQTVDVKDGTVWVDGSSLIEPYTQDLPNLPGPVELPVSVPQDHIWVMGDNRTNSRDSRFFGPVPIASVLARALFVYWPPQDIGVLDGDD